MAESTQLPTCCSPPVAAWPFAHAQPGVSFYSCSFDQLALTPEAFAQAGIAPPVSIQRAADKRQTEYLAGRLCARAALRQQGQQPVCNDRDSEGTPLWPVSWCGSITHSSGLAAAVVAAQQHWQGLGLDAEMLMSASRAQRLAEQILCPDELLRLECLPEGERAWLVSLTFCSKESLFKALFPLVGQRFYFHDAELLDCQADGRLQLRLLRELGPQWPAGSLLHGQHTMLGQHLLSLVSIANGSSTGQ